jgi:glycosyltransferase involved in cell wall biosynthesis
MMGRPLMTDRIRVLIVIDSLRVGGAEALLPTFLKSVDATHFDVAVLALSTAAPNHIQDAIVGAAGSVTQWPARRLRDLRRIREIKQAIEEHDADIVHTHLLYSNVQAALAARSASRPIVTTLHNVHGHNHVLKRTLEVGVLRLTGARALAVSEGVRRSYCGPFGLTERQTTVVPNAIDLSRFARLMPDDVQRTRLEALDGAAGPLLVGVGRVVTQKGFAVLVRAAAEVHERHPGLRVAIAGREADGAKEVREEIERLGLNAVVRLLGQRGDIAELLAGADAYVSPSLSEGAPVTHLEAMAAGAPVVATGVGGVPEIISDGENGLLVPAGQHEPLADALIRLLGDDELARRLADRGRETVREFGADTWARRIEGEYLNVLPSSRRLVVEQVMS